MTSKNTSVFGIYPTPNDAAQAIDVLIQTGFPSSSVSVLTADTRSTHELAHEKHTKAPEGTATGAVAGGAIGGTLGLLVGIGALAIPGLGPFIAAGPIMATLAGAGAGGAVGTLIGALTGLGLPEYEAKRYEGLVKNGGTLLSVHCDTSDQVSSAKEVLKASGARDISAVGESQGEKAYGHAH
jgi:hypothetical protein